MRQLWTVIHQWIGQPRRNGYIPQNTQATWLTQEETENLTGLMTSKEIELIMNNIPTEPDGFTGEIYQIFKKFNNNPFQNLPKIEEGEKVPNSSP